MKRWRYLFLLSSVAAGRKKQTKVRVPTAKDIQNVFYFGGDRDDFGETLLPTTFSPFGVDVQLATDEKLKKNRRPVRDLIWFLVAPEKLETSNVAAKTKFDFQGGDAEAFVNHLRELARQAGFANWVRT